MSRLALPCHDEWASRSNREEVERQMLGRLETEATEAAR